MTDAPVVARLSLATADASAARVDAEVLTGLGFRVRSISPRGVSFEGTAADFERVFKRPVERSAATYRFVGEPKMPLGLTSNVDSVYFPVPPKRF